MTHLCHFSFSSRRRHTRWPRDWSSDVCSSDLTGKAQVDLFAPTPPRPERITPCEDREGVVDRLEQHDGPAHRGTPKNVPGKHRGNGLDHAEAIPRTPEKIMASRRVATINEPGKPAHAAAEVALVGVREFACLCGMIENPVDGIGGEKRTGERQMHATGKDGIEK